MSDCSMRVMNHEIRGKGPAKVIKIVGLVLLGIIGAIVLAAVFGILVKLLWNALMPAIFGLPAIGYWQAIGMVVLGHILFGAGHGSHRYERSRKKKKPVLAEEVEKYSLSREMEQDYAEFWREEGRDAFKSWMRRENGNGSEES